MKKFFSLLFLSVFFFGCNESSVQFDYKLTNPVRLELYAESYFATIDMKGEEQMGTITATYDEVEYSSHEDTLLMNRKYTINNSRGYLKNYMPSELAFRVDEVKLKALDRNVLSLDGLDDGYDSLLNHIPMPEKWKKQLLNPEYKPHLKRLEKHRWEISHLLIGEIPTKGNITELLKERGRLNFALIKIDSVIVKGFENRDKRKCLDYIVYLNETESFPYYIWEQHVNSNIIPEKFKAYNTGLRAEYKTEYEVMLEPTTGILCQEREVKVGTHTMVHPILKDTIKFESHITNERLYNLKRDVEN